MALDVKQIGERVAAESGILNEIRHQISRVIVGQEHLVDRLLLALICNQHVLIEGVPGLAKTLTVTTLARTLHASFTRIQFTPDMLPADITGTRIYKHLKDEFMIEWGPIFANIVLADEINRAPAKVQSALLESMQERQVSLGGQVRHLDDPFLVIATQNPVEQEGTYPLPEAQVDRFMFKVKVDYLSKEHELEVLHRMATTEPDMAVDAVAKPEDILRVRRLADEIFMDEKIGEYIVDLVNATRNPADYDLAELTDLIRYGASPRATLFLAMGARGQALMSGRGYVTPQDVKSVAMDVFRHRVVPTYEAEAEEKTSEEIVQTILDTVDVP
ncbi:MAG: MoxR family ATPase [Victivallales bacterium]|jgi:MoxR-like ATPase|nr:MoxR family ATPase [Victivallales bacterium]MBT7165563.1 MoxR family ATPase [Victivallales bacterium]MBT7299197.1 MoxR family ATPase [Victivallales bacterium]